MKLSEIVKEIERVGEMYRENSHEESKKVYEQYIELIIQNDAEKSEQYNLNNYWGRLKR